MSSAEDETSATAFNRNDDLSLNADKNPQKQKQQTNQSINKQIYQSQNITVNEPQQTQSNPTNQQIKEEPLPPIKIQSVFFYLYFLQGIILGIGSTMPYVYKKLLTSDVMTIFSLSTLAFSLKFLTAPFLQKYTNINYGKRKTWIVISQVLTSLIVFTASYFTDYKNSYWMFILLFFAIFCVSLQDIALDGLAIKQLKIPHVASLLQTVGQTSGWILGGLILLKLSSQQFAYFVGLQNSIVTPKKILQITPLIIMISTILFHAFYQQNVLKDQIQISKQSFTQVIKHYKIFLNTQSRHFRTSIMVLVWLQGINFFVAGYEYQLIKSGFERNDLNKISNFAIIPISIISCIFTRKVFSKIGIKKNIMIVLYSYISLIGLVLIFFPKNYFIVSAIRIGFDFLGTWLFLINSIINTSSPVTGTTGMSLSMLACLSNFGKFKYLHNKMVNIFGLVNCSIFGLILQGAIMFKLSNLLEWVEQGKYSIQQCKINIQQCKKEENSTKDSETNNNLIKQKRTFIVKAIPLSKQMNKEEIKQIDAKIQNNQ